MTTVATWCGELVARWGETGWYRCPNCNREHKSQLRRLDNSQVPVLGSVEPDGLYENQILHCSMCKQPMKTAREMLDEGTLVIGG